MTSSIANGSKQSDDIWFATQLNLCSAEHSIDDSPTEKFRIAVRGITNNARVHHAVLLLHGELIGRPLACTVDSVHVYQLAEQNAGSPLQNRHPLAQRPVGTFKCLVELQPGRNHLLVRCCYAELRLCVFFEPDWPAAAAAATADLNGSLHFYTVRLLLVRAADETDDAADQTDSQRTRLAVQLVQSLYAEKLPDRRTFRLQPLDACRPHRSHLTGEQMSQLTDLQLWQALAVDVIRLQDAEQRKQPAAGRPILHLKFVAIVAGRPSLSGQGGGHLCVLSVPTLVDWPAQLINVPAALCRRPSVAADDAEGSRSTGGCCRSGEGSDIMVANSYASAIGALSHEMAHMFGAGHTRTGLMGGDIDFVARVFCVDVRTVWAPQRCVVVAERTSGTWLEKVDGRLTTVRKSTALHDTLQRYREQQAVDDDRTWFEPCSSTWLATSRWMRTDAELVDSRDDVPMAGALRMDWTKALVYSVAPAPLLRLVEVRRTTDGMMLACWQFERTQSMQSFTVPFELVHELSGVDMLKKLEVFAMDRAGSERMFRVEDDESWKH